jgi:hypothetical protein
MFKDYTPLSASISSFSTDFCTFPTFLLLLFIDYNYLLKIKYRSELAEQQLLRQLYAYVLDQLRQDLDELLLKTRIDLLDLKLLAVDVEIHLVLHELLQIHALEIHVGTHVLALGQHATLRVQNLLSALAVERHELVLDGTQQLGRLVLPLVSHLLTLLYVNAYKTNTYPCSST